MDQLKPLPGRGRFIDEADLELVAAVQRRQRDYADRLVRPHAHRVGLQGKERMPGDWRAKQLMQSREGIVQAFKTPPPWKETMRGLPTLDQLGDAFASRQLTPRQARMLWQVANWGPMHGSTLVSLCGLNPWTPTEGQPWTTETIALGRPSDRGRLAPVPAGVVDEPARANGGRTRASR
jgi:hypothetical protein